MWHDAGFTEYLLPIGPVGAKLSPNSKIDPSQVGKIPLLYDPQAGHWRGCKGWTKRRSTEGDLKKFHSWGAGVGLRTDVFNAGDVDVEDVELANTIEELMIEHLGPAPVRYRDGSARRLLLYRTRDALQKRRVAWRSPSGAIEAVEWLGTGNQCVVEGMHKSGEPYKWRDPHPYDLGPAGLTEVTRAQLDVFIAAVREHIELYGYEFVGRKAERRGTSAKRKPLDDASLHAPNSQLVLEALEYFRNTPENLPTHDDFVQALAAVKAALGPDREEYYPDVEEWGLQYNGNDDEYVRRTWDSIKDAAVGWDWLVAQARKHGFSGDAQLDFADPPYDPKSFFDIDANAVRSQIGELAVLKAGWPEAYEEVRAELDKRSTIRAEELDDLISERMATDEAEPRTKRPKFLLLDELSGLVEPNDFVEGVFCDGQLSVIYGHTNIGKSFLGLDLAMHVALGRTWFGREVQRGGVVYLAGEGGGGIRRRVAAFLRRQGIEQTKGIPFALIPNMIDFRDQQSIRSLIETLHELRARLGVPVRLIIVDTLSRALAGGNENAPDDMGALVRGADQVRAATGAHLCFVHHTGKDDSKGARGHSLLKAAVDTEIEVRRPEGTKGAVTVSVTKQRDLEIGPSFAFRLVDVHLGTNSRGKPITSCVIEPAIIKPVLDEAEQEASEILRTMLFDSEAAYVQIADWREAIMSREGLLAGQKRDTKKRQWQRLRDSLKKKGTVEISGDHVWLKHQ
jgi:hypothetical protein